MFTLLRDLRRLRRQIDLPATTRGRSLAIRHVDAGSCNGCEHELTLATSPYYDLQRYGLNVVASPRHADLLLITGPVTTHMREALLTAYHAMPEPRRVAALGNCALGCNLLGHPDNLIGSAPQSYQLTAADTLLVADSAADPSDSSPDAARIAFYAATFRRAQALAAGATGDTWFVTHRPPYANTNQTRARLQLHWNFAPFDAVLAGHVHDFEAINLTGFPPLVVNGESGDDLDDAGTTAKYIGLQTNAGKPVYTFGTPARYGSKQYGFAVYTKTAAGWAISLRDADGIERRTCVLTKGSVACL